MDFFFFHLLFKHALCSQVKGLGLMATGIQALPSTRCLSHIYLKNGEEDTQLAFSPMLMFWIGVPSGEICNLTCTRRHIEVQVFIPTLAYRMGFHLPHCQHTKLCAGAWICLFANRRVWKLSSASCLFVAAVKLIFWLPNLSTVAFTLLVTRRPNGFIRLDT